MSNPDVDRLLDTHTIAVVGLSGDPGRPSHEVAEYLQQAGYRIVPVNPNLTEVLGEKAYPDLLSVPFDVDVVDIFRRSEFVSDIVDDAIKKGVLGVWTQLGVVDEGAARRGREAGLVVVMDRCMMVAHEHREFARRRAV